MITLITYYQRHALNFIFLNLNLKKKGEEVFCFFTLGPNVYTCATDIAVLGDI